MQNTLDWLIGTDAGTITWWQMTLRACVIFFYGLTLLRLGAIRAFGQSNSFDVVLVVALGSTLSRALTGNAKLLPTLAATTALVLLHTLLAKAAWRSKAVGRVIKGGETKLLENGEIDWEAMRKTRTTKDDLLEALRLKGIGDLSKVNAAYLERSGHISVIVER